MLHTGDIYEIRARSARYQELHRLAKAVSGLLFRPATPANRRFRTDVAPGCANDRSVETHRAA